MHESIFGQSIYTKTFSSTVNKNDFMIVPVRLGKLLLQIRTVANHAMKNKLSYCNL